MEQPPPTGSPDDAGFSLVEVMVSMFLLALLALSFLPLVIRSLTTSSSTTTLATATRLVSEQMETARATSGSCSDFAGADLDGGVARTLTDPRGVVLEVRTDMGACPSGGGVFQYTVWVAKAPSPSARVAEAVTLVAVDPT